MNQFHADVVSTDYPAAPLRPRKMSVGRLRLGTCISTTAAILCLAAPMAAQAADACGAPVDGVVNCPSSGSNYEEGIHYTLDPAEPQDLTVNLGDGLTVDTGNSGQGGVHIANLNGSVTINADGTTVSTAATGATAISGVTYVGDLTIHAGDATTSGDQSDGISASASVGNVEIKADNISTAGEISDGIAVLSDRPDGGDVSIVVGSIATTGNNSKGIDVVAHGGSVDIDAGTVSTRGADSTAIQAIGAGNVAIGVGDISTWGGKSHGVAALSLYGDVAIDAGRIATAGEGSVGIYAFSQTGDVGVNAGYVQTLGYRSDGIVAIAGGNASVAVGDLEALGDYSNGIVAVGASANVHVSGTLLTNGYGSTGIIAIGEAGDVNVKVDGQAVTTFPGSTAILGIGYGNVSIEANKVYTNAHESTGIVGIAYGGSVNITAKNVSTWGTQSGGILALAGPADAEDQTARDVTVTAATVATDGSGRGASGITAANFTYGGDTTVTVTESVSTRRDFASAIISYSQSGVATINVKDASTRGYGATALNADGKSAVVKASGSITTIGDVSAGIRGYASSDGVIITSSGSVETAGNNSYGILAHGFGPLAVTNSGSIKTSGKFSHGVYAIASPGVSSSSTVINDGDILVTGDRSSAIKAVTKGGGVTIASTGTVKAEGNHSAGILAIGDRGGRGEYREGGLFHAAPDKLVSVEAKSVEVTGESSVGIFGINYNGDVSINAANVSATGLGAIGINAIATGKVEIVAGDITSSGIGINVLSTGDASVNVSGDVQSTADTGVVATSRGGNSTVNIAKGGTVTGGGHRVPGYIYGGNGITIRSWYGSATVNNSGFVTTKGDGYAIEMIGFAGQTGGSALIDNDGRIDGAVRVTELDDKFINAGTFNISKDSIFDLGDDLFVNSGTVSLMSGAAANITFQGLETFENKGGLIDLRNGRAGDVFTLPGDYVGSNDASLALDVGGLEADLFVVGGAATGKTKVMLEGLDPGEARLTGNVPIVIIKAGVGSAVDAFELSSSNIGFIRYGLSYDGKSGSYGLVSAAGDAVYRVAKSAEGTDSTWHRSADLLVSHLRSVRDGGDSHRRFWGQAFGHVRVRDESRSIGEEGEPFKLDYRQSQHGAQGGFDVVSEGPVLIGVTAGYLGSKLEFEGATDKLEYRSLNFGIYAGYRAGSLFANALVKYDNSSIKASSEVLGYSERFGGGNLGALLEAGVRLGSDRFFAEPTASLSWLSTDLAKLEALGQTIDFEGAKSLRGKLGARFGGKIGAAGGSTFTYYGGGAVVHELEGKNGATLHSGDISEHVANRSVGTYGEAILGFSHSTPRGFTWFVEAKGEFGDGYQGGGGQAGLRIKL